MKNFSLIVLSSLAACQIVSAQDFNGDRKSYVSDIHAASLIGLSAADSAAAALQAESGLSLSGNYSTYDSDADTDRQFEGDRDISGLSLGYVHALDSVSLGATVSLVQTETDLDGTDANGGTFEADGDGVVLSLGAASQFGKFGVSAVGGWGEISNDSERQSAFALMEADYDSTFYFFETKVTYDLIVNEDYALRPSITLGFQSIEIDGFSEETSALLSDRTDYGDIEDDVFYVELELFAEYYGFDRFVPFASVGVWQDLGDDEVDLEGQSGVLALRTEVPDLFETVITGTLGFTFSVNEQLNIGALVEYFAGDELDGFNLGLSTTYTF